MRSLATDAFSGVCRQARRRPTLGRRYIVAGIPRAGATQQGPTLAFYAARGSAETLACSFVWVFFRRKRQWRNWTRSDGSDVPTDWSPIARYERETGRPPVVKFKSRALKYCAKTGQIRWHQPCFFLAQCTTGIASPHFPGNVHAVDKRHAPD
jgi:hypothetical protein